MRNYLSFYQNFKPNCMRNLNLRKRLLAIALVIAKIVRAILLDQSRVFTVSTMINDLYGVHDICLSIPTVVRSSGTCQRLPLTLDVDEQALFKASASKVHEDIALAMRLLGL